jgi:hypothetical protein
LVRNLHAPTKGESGGLVQLPEQAFQVVTQFEKQQDLNEKLK